MSLSVCIFLFLSWFQHSKKKIAGGECFVDIPKPCRTPVCNPCNSYKWLLHFLTAACLLISSIVRRQQQPTYLSTVSLSSSYSFPARPSHRSTIIITIMCAISSDSPLLITKDKTDRSEYNTATMKLWHLTTEHLWMITKTETTIGVLWNNVLNRSSIRMSVTFVVRVSTWETTSRMLIQFL